jgi:hypothetical protein
MTATGNTPEVLDLVQRWAAAEAHNDSRLLAGHFIGVGPLGFVLNRDRWLARFRNGLENRAFAVEEPQVHQHGGTAAVVVGVLGQQTSFRGATTPAGSGSRSPRCAQETTGCSAAPTSARSRPRRPAPGMIPGCSARSPGKRGCGAVHDRGFGGLERFGLARTSPAPPRSAPPMPRPGSPAWSSTSPAAPS